MAKYCFFYPPLCWCWQTVHVPNPVCVAQHLLELVKGISVHSHRGHPAASSLWALLHGMEKQKYKLGRKSIGFILLSWCWYGCQCFLEYVPITRCVLYEFFIDLASVTVINSIFIQKCHLCQWIWIFACPCFYSLNPWRRLIQEEAEAEWERSQGPHHHHMWLH